MKNVLLITFAMLLTITSLKAAKPSITITSSQTIGAEVSFSIGAFPDTVIYIDWGNGLAQKYPITFIQKTFTGSLSGNYINIFGSIISFGASDQHFDSIDFSGCTDISYIMCNSCGLTSANLSNLPKLENLFINSNQLNSLDLSGDTSLYWIECGENQLTNLDVTNLARLNHLIINNNKLTSLDISNNNMLTYAEIYDNQLTDINLGNATLLTFLNISKNKLVKIDVSKNLLLESIFCGENYLTSIDVTENSFLTQLGCGFNYISGIDVSNNPELFELFCFGNILTQLDVLKNPKLDYLDCAYNHIQSLDLSQNPVLTKVSCSGNQLTQLDLKGDTSLSVLYCNQNELTTLDVSNNNKIMNLYCQLNKLNSLNLGINPELFDLDCSDNNLNTLDLSGCDGLKNIQCNNNKLNILDLSSNDLLVAVQCRDNVLTINSLPESKPEWTSWIYSPQKNLALPKMVYKTYDIIDLSIQLSRSGNTTSYEWKTKTGTVLTKDSDYDGNNGIFTFLKEQTDSVYCEMTNATFPELTLETSRFIVSSITSVNNINESTIIYPNPVKDVLVIKSEKPFKKVEISNVNGVKLLEQYTQSVNSITIPVANLPKGILILKIFNNTDVIETKIITK